MYGKAARKLGYLTFFCLYKGIRPILSVYNLLYKAIIRPSLEYACAFWNGAAESHKRRLERIQRIAMCRILGVMNSTAYCQHHLAAPSIGIKTTTRRSEAVPQMHSVVDQTSSTQSHSRLPDVEEEP